MNANLKKIEYNLGRRPFRKHSFIAAVLVVLLLAAVLWAGKAAGAQADVDRIYRNVAYEADYAVELDSIAVVKQETPYTCNVAAMTIIREYLGAETGERELRRELGVENREKGMVPDIFMEYYNQALAPLSYQGELLNPKSRETILKVITDSLSGGLPVVMLWSTENMFDRPAYDTHYSIIYGIDMKEGIVKISNPYGFLEVLTFDELYAGLNFESYQNAPFIHVAGRLTGIIQPNNLIVLKKI